MKKFTIEEISKLTTIRDRWIKEKVRRLKEIYPDLITGGGKPGANNKYLVDESLLGEIISVKHNKVKDGKIIVKSKKKGTRGKYNEPTKMVNFRCPISKIDELKLCVKAKLLEWSKGDGVIKN
jgi:hypothetical protein